MNLGFETTCVCGTRLVWLRGLRGLVPVAREVAERSAMDRETVSLVSHTNEHEHSVVYLSLERAHLLPPWQP